MRFDFDSERTIGVAFDSEHRFEDFAKRIVQNVRAFAKDVTCCIARISTINRTSVSRAIYSENVTLRIFQIVVESNEVALISNLFFILT